MDKNDGEDEDLWVLLLKVLRVFVCVFVCVCIRVCLQRAQQHKARLGYNW